MAQLFHLLYVFLLGSVALVSCHPHVKGQFQHVMAEGPPTSEGLETSEKVRQALKKAEIIPTVIDDFHPSLILHASWSSHVSAKLGNTIDPSKLHDEPTIILHDIPATNPPDKPSDPSPTPLHGHHDHDHNGDHKHHHAKNTTYIVALTDPDAPSRNNPKYSEYCHWIAWGRVHHHHKDGHHHHGPQEPPCDPKDPTPCPPMPLKDLHEVVSYRGPTPPEKTGLHRYVLLAFVPSNGTTEDLKLSKPKERARWGFDEKEKGLGGWRRGSVTTRGVREWAKENGLSPVAANFVYAENHKQ